MVLGSVPWLETLAMEGCLGAGMSLRMVGTPYTYSSNGACLQKKSACTLMAWPAVVLLSSQI